MQVVEQDGGVGLITRPPPADLGDPETIQTRTSSVVS
jgi:hypothetical protein